jgi:glyoxylase-like metal-dependent hydrolase (beta-lactamase superfamily II)
MTPDPLPIHALNPGPITGSGNWTWLLRGATPTLIDCGTGDPRHIDAVVAALGGASLAQVLVTHAHTDHASGAPAIAARYPGARFFKMPWAARDTKWPVPWQPLVDGEEIAAGDLRLRAVHTPGHAPDHLCFWHEESRTLFGGDLAIQGTTVWIPTSLEGDLVDYLSSLERVLALRPVTIYPAHGAVIADPEGLLRGYLAHRREREEQVLAALREGHGVPDAIVEHIYRGIRERLIPMAKESVFAHLHKLERERRVRRDGDAWHIIGP